MDPYFLTNSGLRRSIYTALSAAGLVPFLVAVLMAALGVESLGPFGSALDIATSYGLAIACFLAGVLWGIYLHEGPEPPLNLFVVSNAAVLAAWFPFVLATAAITIVCLVAVFALLLYVDRRLLKAGIIDASYFRVRFAATAIACASLLLVLVFQ